MKKRKLILLGLGLLSVSTLLISIFFMDGNIRIKNESLEIEKSKTLRCKAEGFWYPLFVYDNSNHKRINLNLVFNKNEINAISIVYTLEYNNKDKAINSEAENHANMNAHYSNDNLNPDAFSSLYTLIGNNLTFNIYAEKNDISAVTYKYFLLDDYSGALSDMDEINNYYTDKGLSCMTNE